MGIVVDGIGAATTISAGGLSRVFTQSANDNEDCAEHATKRNQRVQCENGEEWRVMILQRARNGTHRLRYLRPLGPITVPNCIAVVWLTGQNRSEVAPQIANRISPKSGSVQNKKWIRSKKRHQTTARFVKVL
jgi:hypothetical protein